MIETTGRQKKIKAGTIKSGPAGFCRIAGLTMRAAMMIRSAIKSKKEKIVFL